MENTISIPNKSVFKLNEICGLTGVKPYVIRFWESEFEEISPITSSSGQKLYEHKDIESICTVKKLLFEDKLSIDQVKLFMATGERPDLETSIEEVIPEMINELLVDSTISNHKALTDSEIQKLVLAKAKLNSIIGLIDRRDDLY